MEDATAAAAAPRAGPSRPQLSPSMRSNSYLSEHQQYRPPGKPENHYGIDTVVEDLGGRSPPKSSLPSRPRPVSVSPPVSFNGVPSPTHPPRVVESGLNHELSHPNCAPKKGSSTARLVATLLYRSLASRPHHHHHAPAPASASPTPRPSSPTTASSIEEPSEIPPNMAPTTDPAAFPLEPPTADETLDRLYGSYVSPLCVAAFLHLMSTFPLPPGSTDFTSAHRCLDSLEHPHVVELTLNPAPSPSYLGLGDLRKHELIYRFEREWNVDVVLQMDTVWRRHPRLVVFDMDSTLITQEVIDLLAATIKDPPDLAARVADITHRAMLGELEFDAAFRERVSLLRGLPATLFDDLRPILDVTPGVPALVRALKRLGVRTAVLSGGFLPLTSWLARELGIDHAHANEVHVDDAGKLTGEVKGLIVGKERKRDLLLEIARSEGIAPEQVVAVGDGANDLLMMEAAGLGVAWNAKPRVQMEADARLNSQSLLDMLYLFGFTSEEIALLS
ncbi:hypothetical protein RB595_003223 [Gaeumannomyces hyphopodioides]